MPYVLIVDDDDLTRRSLAQALRLHRYDVAEAGDMREALAHLSAGPCDVVLLDLCLPETLGIDGLALMKAEFPDVQVVIVTGTATVDDAVDCMKGGASDLLTKPVRVARLLEAVARAMVPSSIPPESEGPPPSRKLRSRIANAREHWSLTQREAQVLEAVLRGLANKEIAARAGCSVRTVELHVTSLLVKSGTDSRTALAARFWLTESWD